MPHTILCQSGSNTRLYLVAGLQIKCSSKQCFYINTVVVWLSSADMLLQLSTTYLKLSTEKKLSAASSCCRFIFCVA